MQHIVRQQQLTSGKMRKHLKAAKCVGCCLLLASPHTKQLESILKKYVFLSFLFLTLLPYRHRDSLRNV